MQGTAAEESLTGLDSPWNKADVDDGTLHHLFPNQAILERPGAFESYPAALSMKSRDDDDLDEEEDWDEDDEDESDDEEDLDDEEDEDDWDDEDEDDEDEDDEDDWDEDLEDEDYEEDEDDLADED